MSNKKTTAAWKWNQCELKGCKFLWLESWNHENFYYIWSEIGARPSSPWMGFNSKNCSFHGCVKYQMPHSSKAYHWGLLVLTSMQNLACVMCFPWLAVCYWTAMLNNTQNHTYYISHRCPPITSLESRALKQCFYSLTLTYHTSAILVSLPSVTETAISMILSFSTSRPDISKSTQMIRSVSLSVGAVAPAAV